MEKSQSIIMIEDALKAFSAPRYGHNEYVPLERVLRDAGFEEEDCAHELLDREVGCADCGKSYTDVTNELKEREYDYQEELGVEDYRERERNE